MKYRENKEKAIKAALKTKAQNVKDVNKVGLAEKPMPEMKPTLRLDSKDLPDIKGWSVGKKYTIQLEVEQTSMRQGNEYDFEPADADDKKEISASFKVISAKAV